MEQIKFKDIDNDCYQGGILLDDGCIICGCCGGLISVDDIGDNDQYIARIIARYGGAWQSLDTGILGDDIEDFDEYVEPFNPEDYSISQIKFKDRDDSIHGGILLEDGNILNGASGEIIAASDVCNGIVKVMVVYEDAWENLSELILGDDI